MNLSVGQGILGRYRFRDGTMPTKDRTYLVVKISSTHVGLLNISSSAGKEEKLQRASNEPLLKYEPPFKKPSFAKLDSYVEIPIQYMQQDMISGRTFVLHRGEVLDSTDLNNLLTKMQEFLV